MKISIFAAIAFSVVLVGCATVPESDIKIREISELDTSVWETYTWDAYGLSLKYRGTIEEIDGKVFFPESAIVSIDVFDIDSDASTRELQDYKSISEGAEDYAVGHSLFARSRGNISLTSITDRSEGQPWFARNGFFVDVDERPRFAYVLENEFVTRDNGKRYLYKFHLSDSKIGYAFAERQEFHSLISFH